MDAKYYPPVSPTKGSFVSHTKGNPRIPPYPPLLTIIPNGRETIAAGAALRSPNGSEFRAVLRTSDRDRCDRIEAFWGQRPEKAVRKGRETHKQQWIDCRLLPDQDRED
jgi:hypothetical protein